MPKYLLDTHVALWALDDDYKLSESARIVLSTSSNVICVSIVSAWEIAIKVSTGKANFKGNVASFLKGLQENGIEVIGVLPEYINTVETMPFIHKDPFDRMLIATAKFENMKIITADENIHKYDIEYVW